MDGATQLMHETASLTDLAWCGIDTRYILAGYDNDKGDIVLYGLKTTNLQQANGINAAVTVTVPVRVQTVNQGAAISRCLFLPHEQTVHQQEHVGKTTCFITGSNSNSTFTLWSAFANDKVPPVKLQQIEIPP